MLMTMTDSSDMYRCLQESVARFAAFGQRILAHEQFQSAAKALLVQLSQDKEVMAAVADLCSALLGQSEVRKVRSAIVPLQYR